MGKEFETIVASAPKKQLKSIYYNLTSVGNKQQILKSTQGTMARVVGLTAWYLKPSGGTTGACILEIGYKSDAGGGTFVDNTMLNVSVPYNADLKISNGMARSIGATALDISPVDPTSFTYIINNLYFGSTDTQALRFDFRDTTNGTTSQKYLWITYIEEEIR